MIAITTPTGNIGAKLLRILVESGDRPIRILARRPGKIPDDIRARIEVVEGSVDDPCGSLQSSCQCQSQLHS